MADRYTYLKYKRDEKHIFNWIIHTSDHINKSFPSEAPVAANTTKTAPLARLKSLSALIAKHINPIPTDILRLFKSLIDARKETHDFFLRVKGLDLDPDIRRSNESHEHWINGLIDVFNALGGETWQSGSQFDPDAPNEDDRQTKERGEGGTEEIDGDAPNEDKEQSIFENKFSALSLDSQMKEGGESGKEESDEGANLAGSATPAASRRRKRNKRGRKAKGKRRSADTGSTTSDLQDVPLESYRIIEDESGMVTDYLMAVYSLASQLVDLRHYLQVVWRWVAYRDLNSVVAANLCNVAIGMIRDAQSQIFIDFPDRDSFHTIMKTLTGGDPEKAQGQFRMRVPRQKQDGTGDMSLELDIDVKEHFLLDSYQNLCDFVTDYQATRTGKPTKGMLKIIRNWDPMLDLQRATEKQRLKWRRAYTINWLYDLVNVFSSVVVQQQTLEGQHTPLETVDWSRDGPWSEHRRLFGINDFAGDITHLAVQQPGTDFRSKILPHHVFQLQSIVDSLAVSRGWTVDILEGHDLNDPASEFRPRRDIDLFMGRESESGKGFCQSVDVLTMIFDQNPMLGGDQNTASLKEKLIALRQDFVNWLGETKNTYGLNSRFSNTNSNGLWEYSPFLCGAGLSEALELAYGMGMLLWDKVPEPMCVLRLHKMLVRKRLIRRPVLLWSALESFFQDSSEFAEAINTRIGGPNAHRGSPRNRPQRQQLSRNVTNMTELLDPSVNRFFRTKSLLQVYRGANWIPDRIPDEDIPLPTCLAWIRLTETGKTRDRATGEVTLADTDLVRRARSGGLSDKEIIRSSSTSILLDQPDVSEMTSTSQPTIPEEYPFGPAGGPIKHDISLPTYLNLLKRDLIADVCGRMRPLSSLNYNSVLVHCYWMFLKIEERLQACYNQTWQQAYLGESGLTQRGSLTMAALGGKDPECLEIIAGVFEEQRPGFMDHIYWDTLLDSDDEREIVAPEGNKALSS
ncbi:hypothetical protein N7519_011613 [Penicillium mononematosum]|uniref:uncharacterized protein n=1 Tax=Penicillium mononematosum TaxID=268346 RepID=UPI002547E956|nr:uncharacterized protein N7519_011613 [Penicillium mononematosum]KAJ6181152.1 hypothetical protein N7519_011613 [Penicillium mononematosum]